MTNKEFIASKRRHICLITNHGYAGVDLSIGGAPDSGGQIIYVNDYAKALDQLGYKVTIFTRGGFPFFEKKKIRKGVEFLSDYARYVYVPGGPEIFLPKEDIGNILDEEVEWVYDFINKEAAIKKVKPSSYFYFINSHYWDAAIIGMKLVKRWQNDLFMEKIKKVKFHKSIIQSYYSSRHRLALYNSLTYFTGEMFFYHVKKTINKHLPDNLEILNYKDNILQALEHIIKKNQRVFKIFLDEVTLETRTVIKPAIFTFVIQKLGKFILERLLPDLETDMKKINRHIWTPHSLGALKERNYWNKDVEKKRKLKFLERNCYEKHIIYQTPGLVATSDEIIKVFCNYYDTYLEKMLYFPPGNDETVFKPREKKECRKTWQYLSGITGIGIKELMNKRIIFETSRMDNTKRKDVLIDAFKLIMNDYKDVILVIGGGPDNKVLNHLKKKVKENKLSHQVFLTGFIPDENISDMFSIATIFATASEMEGFGISVLNAISSRVPVLSSNLIPLSVQYLEKCSIIVSAGDAKAFARGMKKYLSDPSLIDDYKEKSYKISAHFNWKSLTKHLIEELRKKQIV